MGTGRGMRLCTHQKPVPVPRYGFLRGTGTGMMKNG
jgi:hypothetical protein